MQNGSVEEIAHSVPRELGLSLNLLFINWVTLGSLPKLTEYQIHCLYELINTFSCHNVCHKNLKKKSKVLLLGRTRALRSESIMLSEISQEVRDKYHMISPLTGT